MKIRNLFLYAACAAAIFAAVAFSACSGGHEVTVIGTRNGAPTGEKYSVRVKDGEKFSWDVLRKEYPDLGNTDTGFMRDDGFYTDSGCLVRYTAGVDSDMTLYFGNYSAEAYGKVVFKYGGAEYSIFRKYGAVLSDADFCRSAYGVGEAKDYLFYEDPDFSKRLDIASVTISSNAGREIVIYVADA